MKLNKNELKLLHRICETYNKTKELVMEAEYLDVELGANLQINKEFRDALSHILRVFTDILLDEGHKKKHPDDGIDYYLTNLDKSLGHIYRAGYDAIDCITILLREIANKTEHIPLSIKQKVIPNFIDIIFRIDTLSDLVKIRKNSKDIGHSALQKFEQTIKELQEVRSDMEHIRVSIPEMNELYIKEVKRWRADFLWKIGGVMLGIVGIGVSIFCWLYPCI